MKKVIGIFLMIFISLFSLTICGKNLLDYNEYYVEIDVLLI